MHVSGKSIHWWEEMSCLFEMFVTASRCDLWHEPLSFPSLIWNRSHEESAPSRATLVSGGGQQPLHPHIFRCEHCVCRFQFGGQRFSDRTCSVPVSACRIFYIFFWFVSLCKDEKGCPFLFNKQTDVWINKRRGSGCRPGRTASSLSLCLPSLLRAWRPCRRKLIRPESAHDGLQHTNRICESCATPTSLWFNLSCSLGSSGKTRYLFTCMCLTLSLTTD